MNCNSPLHLTVQQFRELLFMLDEQTMTISELRARLFRIEPQDQLIDGHIPFNVWKKLGVEK